MRSGSPGSSSYWGGYAFFPLGHDPDRSTILRLYVLLPLALFFLPTVLMGVSFPILQRAVHDDPATSGRKVGALQAANIAGCAAGSLLVGLVFLQHLGTPGTLRLLVLVGVLFALVGARYYGRVFALPAIALLLLAAAVPGEERLWRRLHGVPAGTPLAFFDEDATSVVALTPDEGGWRLSVNGKGNSWLPYGSGHTVLGAMPATVHPAPVDVAVVGLGLGRHRVGGGLARGDALASPSSRSPPPSPGSCGAWSGWWTSCDTRRLLEDPRLRIRIEDGRKALEAGEDALRPRRDGRHVARDRRQRQPVLGRVLRRPRRAGSSRAESCARGRPPRGSRRASAPCSRTSSRRRAETS